MHHDQTSLAALIGSRICHDLINPIGAISNGLELVALSSPDPNGPEMTLIQQSCDNATARIRFLRIAFGSAGDHRPIATAEARKTLIAHYDGTRITPEWHCAADLPRSAVQLAYLLVLCVETALPQGGTVLVSDGASGIKVTATGPGIARHPVLWDLLDTPTGAIKGELRPAHVQFGLLSALCHAAGGRPRFVFGDQTAEVELSLLSETA
jgi:histidine phosphotransferase ChpT